MTECAKCNTRLSRKESENRWLLESSHPELYNKAICDECFRDLLRQQNSANNNQEILTCRLCHYASKRVIELERASFTNLLGAFTSAGTMDYDYVDQWSCSKFGFDLTHKLSLAEECSSYVTEEDYQQKCVSGEMEKRNVQIILDFSSLKDVMSKGGLVMTTYKCPSCSGMVDIPETGKVLVCKYCGSPIKPVDIFEKIKSLMQ